MNLDKLQKDEALVFVHIPKTAGTSVNEFVVSHFHEDETNYPDNIFQHEILKLDPEQLNHYRYITGHFNWAAVNSITGKKRVFTIFRDPIERTVSQFLQIYVTYGNKRKEEMQGTKVLQHIHQRFVREEIGFEEFVNDELFQKCFIINLQCRQLGSEVTAPNPLTSSMDWFYDKERLYDCQIKIKDMAFWGFQYDMNTTYKIMTYVCGWKMPEKIPAYRVNMKSQEIYKGLSEEMRSKLKSMLALDYELMEVMKDRFEEVKTRISEKEINDRFMETVRENHAIRDQVPQNLMYGSGWHRLENFENYKARWTGPKTASLVHGYSEDCSDKALLMKISYVLTENYENHLRISMNDEEVSYKTTKISRDKYLLTAFVDGKILKKCDGVFELKIEYDNPMIPKSVGISSDERKIGLQISTIRLVNM